MAVVYLQLHFTAVGMVPLFRGQACRIPSLPCFMCAFLPCLLFKCILVLKFTLIPGDGWTLEVENCLIQGVVSWAV